jgi:alanine dehydrogenase
MRIGCPRERKAEEFRVALTPHAVAELRKAGHDVLLETGAGTGAGFSDDAFSRAGARIAATEAEVFACDLVIKVKEPIAEEYALLRAETVLFCYLHLAAVPALADELLKRRVTAIAFETITADDGSLPLLMPMSMAAGRLAVQIGATCLQKEQGGKGLLLAGLPGVPPAHVLILGAGTVGRAALQSAVGLGARVTVVDRNPAVLQNLDAIYAGRIETLTPTEESLTIAVRSADLVIGAVLIPGAKAPRLVTRKMVKSMEAGSVIVDVSVDQGGCIETTRVTSHHAPTYVEEGVVHYAVPNMPSLVSRTTTQALSNATLPVLLALAQGVGLALQDRHIHAGLTTDGGAIVHPKVAEALAGGQSA